MQDVHIGALDLNLLRVLNTLLQTRHVTRASKALGLSQSATSHALARLRATLGDELLVRSGSALCLTTYAEELAPRLAAALTSVEQVLAPAQPFDPKVAKRTFVLASSDYAQYVLLPRLLRVLAKEAPHIDVWVRDIPLGEALRLSETGEVDLAFAPPTVLPERSGARTKTLFTERFVCVVRKGHPVLRSKLTLAKYAELPHAFVAPRGTRGGVVDEALAKHGLVRRVALAVPHFLVAPHAVLHSDLIITLAARVASSFAESFALAVLAPPVKLPAFRIAMWWHERANNDPAHAWLRAKLDAIGAELRAEAISPPRGRV